MKEFKLKGYGSSERIVIDLEEPVKINFLKQVEDIIMSSPDVNILYGCDYETESDFNEMNAMLLKTFDNLKEISKERCTHLYIMPAEKGTKGRVYIEGQR